MRKRKPLLSEAERTKLNKSREDQEHTCPLCGSYAEASFSRMMCVEPLCKNYDSRVKKKADQLSFDEETMRYMPDWLRKI